MNVFKKLQVYADSWKVVSERPFDAEEIGAVSNAEVVSSEYGLSVCFHMDSGGQTYIPLSRDSSLTVGDTVDLTKAKLLTLSRSGSNDINRVMA